MRFINALAAIVTILAGLTTVFAFATENPTLCGYYGQVGIHLCRGGGDVDGTVWAHNGSTVYLVVRGSQREFRYQEPTGGMRAAGAAATSTVFEGERDGDLWRGNAFIFSKACGKIAYHVQGWRSGNFLELDGDTPFRDTSCKVTHSGGSDRNDHLKFYLIR